MLEEERVDDPLWIQDEDEEEEVDELEEIFLDTGKKQPKKYDKTEKLAKCPHCFREFTNLKHHINQQHSQV